MLRMIGGIKMIYKDIVFIYPEDMALEHVRHYGDMIINKHEGKNITSIELRYDGDYVDAKWSTDPVDFQRIRRITGYLVGTLDRFNDAKKSEEMSRVKHT